MSHIGILALYLPGHLHPALALGAHLRERGHTVSVVSILDTAPACERAALPLLAFGQSTLPRGAAAKAQASIGALQGEQAFALFLEHMSVLARAALAEVPALLERTQFDLLIVDQLFPGGATLAEHAGVRFATFAAALMMDREDSVPPPIFAWPPGNSAQAVERNRAGWAALARMFDPLQEQLNQQRAAWALPRYTDLLGESNSPLLTLAQEPPSLEFPRRELPQTVHLIGPLRRPEVFPHAPLPWEKLGGKPLLYASFGTLQNGLEWAFRAIFEALRGLDLQAIVSLGGGALVGSSALGEPPENVLLVAYAPQLEVLARADVAITHAGLNTTTDCLAAGVPMVAIPVSSEQPGIAARICFTGAGVMIPLAELSAERLRTALLEVLGNPGYRERAREQAAQIRLLRPFEEATHLIEAILPGRHARQ